MRKQKRDRHTAKGDKDDRLAQMAHKTVEEYIRDKGMIGIGQEDTE